MRERLLVLSAVLALLLVPAAAVADEATPEEPPAAPEVREATDEEASELADLLAKAARKRLASDVMPVLDRLAGLSHPSFHKTLVKLLSHESPEVALRAADLLAIQRLAEARDRVALAKDVWKQGFAHADNDERLLVRGRTLKTVGLLQQKPLAERDGKEVERLWRRIVGSPDPLQAPVLLDICAYVRATGEKRLCRLLAEEIDEPVAKNPNDPNNPPYSWWEARWKLWSEVRSDVADTLKALTGESFKDTETAKLWFEAHRRDFGFDW